MKWTFIFLCLLIANALYSRLPDEIDSIIKINSEKGIHDTMKVRNLNELSYLLVNSNPDAALAYAGEALNLAQEIGYKRGEADSWMRIGSVAESTGNYEKAIQCLHNALPLRRKHGVGNEYASVFQNLGIVYKGQQKLDAALINYQIADSLTRRSSDFQFRSILQNNIGNLLKKKGDVDLAYGKYLQALDLLKQHEGRLDDSSFLADIYLNMGNIHEKQRRLESAANHYRNAIPIYRRANNLIGVARTKNDWANIFFLEGDMDSALDYYMSSLKLKDSVGSVRGIGSTINNIGLIYAEKELYDSALIYYRRNIRLREEYHDTAGLAIGWHNIAPVHSSQGNSDSALYCLRKSFAFSEKVPDKSTQMEVSLSLANELEEQGALGEALRYLHIHIQYRDSVYGSYKDATELELKYQEEQSRIEKLEIENQKQLAENQKQTILITALAAGIILFVVGFILFFRAYRRQKNAQLALNEQKLKEQEYEKLLTEKEIQYRDAEIKGQIDERKRIAQEMHDGLGGKIFTAKAFVESNFRTFQKTGNINKDKYDESLDILKDASTEVRRIVNDLKSKKFEKENLNESIKKMCKQYGETRNLKIAYLPYNMEDFRDNDVAFELYRILQELLNNVDKHAEASEVSVQLQRHDELINIIVQDDGKGFDTNGKEFKYGLGLKGIQTRVERLNGKVIFDSGKGSGTTVTIDIPITSKIDRHD